jgi:hypothetical protein
MPKILTKGQFVTEPWFSGHIAGNMLQLIDVGFAQAGTTLTFTKKR